MDIRCTKDYTLFAQMPGNRPVGDRVAGIAESMKMYGFIISYHIVVNSAMCVIDGQHRLEAAKIVGCPVYYVVDDKIGIDEVRHAGKLGRQWSWLDYVNSYADLGNDNYIRLRRLIVDSPFKLSIIKTMLTRCYSKDIAKFGYDCMSGSLDFAHSCEAKYHQVSVWVNDIIGIQPEYKSSVHAFNGLMSLFFHPRYSHDRMLEKLLYTSTRFVRCYSAKEYQLLFYSIYNFKAQRENRIEPPPNVCSAQVRP